MISLQYEEKSQVPDYVTGYIILLFIDKEHHRLHFDSSLNTFSMLKPDEPVICNSFVCLILQELFFFFGSQNSIPRNTKAPTSTVYLNSFKRNKGSIFVNEFLLWKQQYNTFSLKTLTGLTEVCVRMRVYTHQMAHV